MKNTVIGVIVVVVLVVGGVVLALSSKSDEPEPTNETTSTPAPSQESETTTAPAAEPGATATITYSEDGFSPSTLTVKSGTTVTVKNTSSNSMKFDSDPHPQHTNNEELNVENVSPGDSQTFVANTKGTFGYHNHLNPSETGTIIVE